MMKKKINLFIFGMFLFLGVVFKVDAVAEAFKNQEIFFHDWDTEDVFLQNSESLLALDKIYYEHGYIVVDLELDYDNETYNTRLLKYDISGNLIAEKSLSDTVITQAELIGDKIYTLSMVFNKVSESPIISINIYDLDFKMNDQYLLGNGDIALDVFFYSMRAKQLNLDVFSEDDKGNGYLLIYGYPDVLAFGPDYPSIELLEGSEYVYKYFPYYEKLEHSSDGFNYIGYDVDEEYEVLSGSNGCSNNFYIPSLAKGIESVGLNCSSIGVLSLYNDEDEVWSYPYYDYVDIMNPRFVDDYIVAVGVTSDNNREIIVVDREGKLLQKIQSEYGYAYLTGGDKSFIVTTVTPSENTSCSVDQSLVDGLDVSGINSILDVGESAPTCYDYHNEVWYIPLVVETKTDGNGTVTAAESSRYGEEVTFTVTPKEGYVLGEVKVTDENGNIVVFTDYHFTMPNANVVIDVTFVPENPVTADIAIIILVVIAGFTGFAFIKTRKKIV